jgi:hypothetical protein
MVRATDKVSKDNPIVDNRKESSDRQNKWDFVVGRQHTAAQRKHFLAGYGFALP